MDKKYIASLIDHAILKPEATDEDLKRECKLADEFKVATVCVKPSHIKLAKQLLKDSTVGVCTVIGFPHGSTSTTCKVAESEEAIADGADELDMVINIGRLLSKDDIFVENDIKAVVDVAHKNGKALKVIIETSLLSEEMKVKACKLSENAGADYVKTSTGFNGGGASIADINLMRNSVSSKVKLKASGGIKTYEQALEFINAGCSRLGTSAVKSILEGSDYKGQY